MRPKILIVEDDKYSYLLLKNYLRIYQPEILWVKTGNEALQIFKADKEWDLIFMDIALPDANGYVITKELKKINPNLIIIAETANALYGDRNKSLQAGCNDYITKPIQKQQFYTMLEKWGISVGE